MEALMTHAHQCLLKRLFDTDISLTVDDGELVVKGAKGEMTADLQTALREAKNDLLRAFHRRADFLKENLGRAGFPG